MYPQSLENSYSDGNSLGIADSYPELREPVPVIKKDTVSSKKLWIAFILVFLGSMTAVYFAYSQRDSAIEKTALADAEAEDLTERLSVAEKAASDANLELAKVQGLLATSEANRQAVEVVAKEKQEVASELELKLQSLLGEGEGQVVKGEDGKLTLQLVDKILFRSGKAELTKRGQRVMARVGKALKDMDDKQVWVQGHTDKVPVKKDNAEFASNWELSSARALSVVHYLQNVSEVDPARLAAAAFSSYRPISRRRAKNRRIEIVLFPRDVKLKRKRK